LLLYTFTHPLHLLTVIRYNIIIKKYVLKNIFNKRKLVTKNQFFTRRSNNILTIAIGVPVLAYILLVSTTTLFSDFTGFLGMVILGVVY